MSRHHDQNTTSIGVGKRRREVRFTFAEAVAVDLVNLLWNVAAPGGVPNLEACRQLISAGAAGYVGRVGREAAALELEDLAAAIRRGDRGLQS